MRPFARVNTRKTHPVTAFGRTLGEFDYRSHLSVRSKTDLCRIFLGREVFWAKHAAFVKLVSKVLSPDGVLMY
jgi:hypothetical protein